MSTSNPNGPPTFPDKLQFNGANFLHFKNRVLIAAHVHGAKGYLEGTIPCSDPPTNSEADKKPLRKATKSPVEPVNTREQAIATTTPWTSHNSTEEEWDLRNAWTLGLIVYNCKNPVGLGIKMYGTAAEAWNLLTKAYGVVFNLATMGAKNALCATRFANGTDFPTHIADLRIKWSEAMEKGVNISDSTFQSIVMTSLPELWNTVVASMPPNPLGETENAKIVSPVCDSTTDKRQSL
ncbi:hypothetical protein C0993_008961 [Termitomyces sp. T159_Od127]|nr:hypothetical protein C0993_008961 [Termitomyces sp. T159_Od127]